MQLDCIVQGNGIFLQLVRKTLALSALTLLKYFEMLLQPLCYLYWIGQGNGNFLWLILQYIIYIDLLQ